MSNPKFVNLTPHNINLNDGTVIEPSGQVARVSQSFTKPNEKNICRQEFGDVVNLPNPQEGVIYITSGIVLGAAKQQGRTDVVAPATGHPDTIRNEKGYVVSVPCFVQ